MSEQKIDYINDEEKQLVELLTKINQLHIISLIPKFSKQDRLAFINQIQNFNITYPGGIEEYYKRAIEILKVQLNNQNPYDGYTPTIPQGEIVQFKNIEKLNKLEAIGIEELQKACFVLVAGGCGERLGYHGIKVSLPVDLVSNLCFLEYQIQFILAFQKKGNKIPFAIMTSDETHNQTINLLQEHNYFGMPQDQVQLIKQKKVPCIIDQEAHFSIVQGKLEIETKPHGHGDVHNVLFNSGLVEKWEQQGRKWIVVFQDTNPLIFRAIPSVVGVSKLQNYEVNSTAVPRKPGDAMGEICKLEHKDGHSITVNVEYNQIDAYWQNLLGKNEELDENGCSHYPGNINSLVFSIPEYFRTLQKTKGLITEYINPKYEDDKKMKFKTSARLECMMQDYPKLLRYSDRIGYTQVDRNFCFSPIKNDISTAIKKLNENIHPECAGTCEQDFYAMNAELLRLAGAQIEYQSEDNKINFYGITYNFGPKIVLHPNFGVTLAEIKNNLKGKVYISKNSTLYIKGNISLGDLSLDGILKLEGCGSIGQITVNDKVYNKFVQIDTEDKKIPECLRIRGYQLI